MKQREAKDKPDGEICWVFYLLDQIDLFQTSNNNNKKQVDPIKWTVNAHRRYR